LCKGSPLFWEGLTIFPLQLHPTTGVFPPPPYFVAFPFRGTLAGWAGGTGDAPFHWVLAGAVLGGFPVTGGDPPFFFPPPPSAVVVVFWILFFYGRAPPLPPLERSPRVPRHFLRCPPVSWGPFFPLSRPSAGFRHLMFGSGAGPPKKLVLSLRVGTQPFPRTVLSNLFFAILGLIPPLYRKPTPSEVRWRTFQSTPVQQEGGL